MYTSQLFTLLDERGIAPSEKQPVTLMRHKDNEHPLHKYIGTEALALYQARQLIRHEPGGLIVGFYGHRVDHGLLLGVWRITGVMSAAEAYDRGLLKGGFESPEESRQGYFHELQETPLLADLRLKLEIRWGGRPNSWRRVLKSSDDYPVVVRGEPPVRWEGAHKASLVMAALRIALDDIEWQRELGTVAGVYLITDELSGKQYVGSATGKSGIWQRWKEYAMTGHGGNKLLIDLLGTFPGRENEFRFTLLESLPQDSATDYVISRECYWKIALGSQAFGLNGN